MVREEGFEGRAGASEEVEDEVAGVVWLLADIDDVVGAIVECELAVKSSLLSPSESRQCSLKRLPAPLALSQGFGGDAAAAIAAKISYCWIEEVVLLLVASLTSITLESQSYFIESRDRNMTLRGSSAFENSLRHRQF